MLAEDRRSLSGGVPALTCAFPRSCVFACSAAPAWDFSTGTASSLLRRSASSFRFLLLP